MSESTKNHLIVVLGMHRSGTSALTKSLEVLGVGLGSDLHPAGFDNPTGFWEDKECLAINDALLAHLGSAYDRLSGAWSSIPDDATTSELKLRAARVVTRRLAQSGGKWGFKDPRTCRLLAFWHEVFASIPCQVHFVIAVRNPASVALSMSERNGIPAEKAYLLWLQHVVPTITETRGFSRVVVDYDQFLASPLHHVHRVAAAFKFDILKERVGEFEKNFLEHSLRHSVHSLAMLKLDRRAPPAAVDAYELLAQLASDEMSLNDPDLARRFDQFKSYLNASEPAFSYANALEDERITLWHTIGERDKQLGEASTLIAGASEREKAEQERTGQLSADLLAKEAEVLALQRSLAERELANEAEVLALQRALAERDRTNEASTETWRQRVEALQAHEQELIHTCESKVAALHNALAEREQSALSEFELLRDDMLQLGRSVHLSEQELSGLFMAADAAASAGANRASVSDVRRALSALGAAIGQRVQRLRDLEQEIPWQRQAADDVRRELAQVLASKSWRATKPLRWARRQAVSRPFAAARPAVSEAVRGAWHWLPVPGPWKRALKDAAFKALPQVFSKTKAYEAWINFNTPIRHERGWVSVSTPVPPASSTDYVPLHRGAPIEIKPVRLICFYLPQFHPIDENNEWWGEGFTEWTNVRPARPQFQGHYQPHIPDELGYYDLLDAKTQRRQVELAKLYGVEGFCFYFYWFGGKRLLEQPIKNYLDNADLDLPFCLCWANENWSRRWDGLDSEILIAQKHSPEDDIAFIAHVSEYMRDPRYIRIDGRPLLIIYRPSLLPDSRATVARWRRWCRGNNIGEIYLAYTQSFEAVDPEKYGFDGAIEFPPNNSAPPNVTDTVSPSVEDFGTTVYDWNVFLERSKAYKPQGYRLFRSVCPSWDNTARKKNRGTVFLNSTPEKYREWLVNAIRETRAVSRSPDDNLVFVNAWNEWAEGAHLEPDARYGYAWLQATRDALEECGASARGTRRIILVSHDAHPHGAQYLALNIAKTLSSDLGFQVDLVLLGEGVLKAEYEKWARVHDLAGVDPCGPRAVALARALRDLGHTSAIVNTTVSGLFLQALKAAEIHCVVLVHELPGVIKSHHLSTHAQSIASHADAMVFPAKQVADAFLGMVAQPAAREFIRPQGLYKKNRYKNQKIDARRELRKLLGIPADAEVVVNVGYADHRKGVDRFVRIGQEVLKARPRTVFVWVGHWDTEMRRKIDHALSEDTCAARLVFVGRQDDTDIHYAGADVFALTSREDPFPSVVLEALEVALPVVGFAGAGGFSDLLSEGGGVVVAEGDEREFAGALCRLLDAPAESTSLGLAGAEIVAKRFSFRRYVYDLLELAGQPLARVTAVVPNFNYARYLAQRLKSIVNQTYPVHDIVVLDDASTDDSLSIIREFMKAHAIDISIIESDVNSGSVFKQWKTGVQAAAGNYVWICEADDDADPMLVQRLVPALADSTVVMAYAQSFQIDEAGRMIADSYLGYTDEVSSSKWIADYVCDGTDELREALAIKNTIPNVSAAIFLRSAFLDAMDDSQRHLVRLKIAGDWLVYANILKRGKIAFMAEALNFHRRHNGSVTASDSTKVRHLAEIIFMQDYVNEILGCPESSRRAADAYARKIYNQFLLDRAHSDSPQKNPKVAEALAYLHGD